MIDQFRIPHRRPDPSKGLPTGACPAKLNRDGEPQTGEDLHAFAYQYGEQYDSYLATEPGRELFWSSGERGLISFTPHSPPCARGRRAHRSRRNTNCRLLEEFLDHTERLPLAARLLLHQEEDLPIFRDVGFRVTKLGEDAIVDLGDCTFGGKPYEWVRRQANYCSETDWSRAKPVQDCNLPKNGTPRWPKFSRFVATRWPTNRSRRNWSSSTDASANTNWDCGDCLSPAVRRRGRIEGFVVCNPMRGGRAGRRRSIVIGRTAFAGRCHFCFII